MPNEQEASVESGGKLWGDWPGMEIVSGEEEDFSQEDVPMAVSLADGPCWCRHRYQRKLRTIHVSFSFLH